MALADYDTAVEKIAALKAATLDPSIMNLAVTAFTPNDDIYLIACKGAALNGIPVVFEYDLGIQSIDFKVNSGTAITGNKAVLYVKDSDIVYTDPITTYQNRLAGSLINDNTIVYDFTTGANGSIFIAGEYVHLNGTYLDLNTSWVFRFAVPSGVTVTSDYCAYFDVPADW